MKASELRKPDYLTADQILSKVSQEEIFSYYGLPVQTGKIKNPFRKDSSPGCNFNVSDGWIYFWDRVWSDKGLNCFLFVQKLFSISYGEALKKINNEVIGKHVNRIPKPTIDKTLFESNKEFKIKIRDFTQTELAFWNINGFTITQQLLHSEGIYAVETIWAEDTYVNQKMVFAYITDNQVKQLYFPLNKYNGRMRFRNQLGFKLSGMGNPTFNYLLITKAKKCCFYLKLMGVNCEYIVNEKYVIDAFTWEMLESMYDYIFILADNDITGKKLLVKYRKEYPSCIPLLYKTEDGKDTTEVIINKGRDYVENLKNQIKEKYEL